MAPKRKAPAQDPEVDDGINDANDEEVRCIGYGGANSVMALFPLLLAATSPSPSNSPLSSVRHSIPVIPKMLTSGTWPRPGG
jgi:hypothetical protein